MNWTSVDQPGFTVYTVEVAERQYRIQSKLGVGIWRLFVRDNESEPLRTIYHGEGLEDCQRYAEAYDGLGGK